MHPPLESLRGYVNTPYHNLQRPWIWDVSWETT